MRFKSLLLTSVPFLCSTPLVFGQTAPAVQSQPALKTSFNKGDSLNDYFNAIATRFSIVVMLQPETAKGVVTAPMELPTTLEDALKAAKTACESQGFVLTTATEGEKTIVRITSKEPPKQAEAAVGPAPAPDRAPRPAGLPMGTAGAGRRG